MALVKTEQVDKLNVREEMGEAAAKEASVAIKTAIA